MLHHRHNRKRSSHADTVRVSGRLLPVIDQVRIGRKTYLVLERIGRGAAERYMAFDPQAGPQGDLRAILALPKSNTTRQHVGVLQRMSATNVNLPTIIDYAAQRDQIWLVMTWVRGPDLEQFLADVERARRPRPSAAQAFRLARGLAHGLAQLHRRKRIVHGDLKPANLVLASHPSRLVMIDFGSAWMVQRTAWRECGDGVSAAYAAPEVQTGQTQVDFRSDLFSASVILYELLTLQLPYDNLGGKAGRPQHAAAMNGHLILPSRLSPDRRRLPQSLWAGIDEIAAHGLALNPDARFATSDAWLADVDAVYAEMHLRSRLTPVNRRLTGLVSWFGRLFGNE